MNKNPPQPSFVKGGRKKIKVIVAMSPHKSLRDYTGQAGGVKKSRIIVAMSGGVDSSVAAALLVERGYQVEGVYMKLFDKPRNHAEPFDKLRAEQHGKSESGERYARAVAEKLGIKFKVLDFRKEFEKRVINYFLREFATGRTPNPCVVCNQQIKFGLLFDKVLNPPAGGGADFVATGHYARIENCHCEGSRRAGRQSNLGDTLRDRHAPLCEARDDIKKLLTAKDKTKDQSYFLYNLTQERLKKVLFPLRDYKKSEVYEMAEKRQLPFKKGESMDICFIAGRNHRDFLKKHLGARPGNIIDTNGKILGQHQGLWFYTIGQRAEVGGPGPFFVVSLEIKKNNVVVTNNFRDTLLRKKSFTAKNVNWISGVIPKMPLKCRVRIRYGHVAVPCVIAKTPYLMRGTKQSWDDSMRLLSRQLAGRNDERINYLVKFKNLQRAITPGQSAVFYKRNEVLGGGVIKI